MNVRVNQVPPESCTPGYYNNEGKPFDTAGSSGTFWGRAQNGPCGGGPIAFVKILRTGAPTVNWPGWNLR